MNRNELFDYLDSVIERIYIKKDYQFFKEQAERPDFVLPRQVKYFLKKERVKTIKYQNKDENGLVFRPCTPWKFTFPTVHIGLSPLKIETHLEVSKVVNVYTYSHSFILEDNLAKPSSLFYGILEGTNTCDDFITYETAAFSNLLNEQMERKGYVKLSFREAMYEYYGLFQKFRDDDTERQLTSLSDSRFRTTYFDLLFEDSQLILPGSQD